MYHPIGKFHIISGIKRAIDLVESFVIIDTMCPPKNTFENFNRTLDAASCITKLFHCFRNGGDRFLLDILHPQSNDKCS